MSISLDEINDLSYNERAEQLEKFSEQITGLQATIRLIERQIKNYYFNNVNTPTEKTVIRNVDEILKVAKQNGLMK